MVSEVIASLEVIEVNEVSDVRLALGFSTSRTIVVNFERSDNFVKFDKFKDIRLAKVKYIRDF